MGVKSLFLTPILTLCLCLSLFAQTPILQVTPPQFGSPVIWTKPYVPLDTNFIVENIGSATLSIYELNAVDISHAYGATVDDISPFDIPPSADSSVAVSVTFNSGGTLTGPTILTGYFEIISNSNGSSADSIAFKVIIADTVQMPEFAEIRTESLRLVFGNNGNIGRNSYLGLGGYNMNFLQDCDTTDNWVGNDDNASVYLAAGSPFLMYIDAGDTVLEHSMFDRPYYDTDFKPRDGILADSTTVQDYRYGYTGHYYNSDTSITMYNEYYAPRNVDTSNFIIARQAFINNTDATLTGIYFGEIMDWNIPSDSGDYNGSDFNADDQSMWCFGAEYGDDNIVNNDCIYADQRMGGFAYYKGCNPLYGGWGQAVTSTKAVWTENNSDWIDPTGDFVPGQLYQKASYTDGYETWEATGDFSNPDSMYQDLHMVVVYGQFDIEPADTVSFVKIYASEYDGGEYALQESITKAKAWIEGRPNQFPEVSCEGPHSCCYYCGLMMGDLNASYSINILDITALIAYLYQNESGYELWCEAQADINCDCAVNILDITCMISHLYSPSDACQFCTCLDWENNCLDLENILTKKPPCVNN